MPGNRLSLAILISCQIKFVGFFQSLLKVAYSLLFIASDNVVRLEIIINVNAEFAVFFFVFRRNLRGLRQIPNMPHRCSDIII